MNKYLVELKHQNTEDMYLLQLDADSPEQAHDRAKELNPECVVVKVKTTHGGKREGSGRKSPWGEDVVTERRRLPSKYSQKAEEIISELDMVNSILECWESKVTESIAKTGKGVPGERYKYVQQLLDDLRKAMNVTSEKLV
jgi:hypothetical protein